MRVALARALFADPDLLLLDEPTNHLDLHAVAWLEEYLAEHETTLIIVSHARDFLNAICTDMIDLRDQKFTYYKGDFDTFEKVKADQLLEMEREAEAQGREKAHLNKFIDKFRYNAKRASLVQSRIKALARLPMLEAITADPTLQFAFEDPDALPNLVQLQEVGFTYPTTDTGSRDKFGLHNLSMTVDMDSRIAIVGENGSGKSTLLKLLMGQLEAEVGHVQRHNRLKLGYFTQHHVDSLDLTLTATQQMQARFPTGNISDLEARRFLGKFGVIDNLALEPLYVLSGGQKSRVALALLAYARPHLLVMDEPTNHLDLDAVQALTAAINQFQGAVVLVSHDAHFLQCTCDEVVYVQSHTCQRFKGDVSDFIKYVKKEHAKKKKART